MPHNRFNSFLHLLCLIFILVGLAACDLDSGLSSRRVSSEVSDRQDSIDGIGESPVNEDGNTYEDSDPAEDILLSDKILKTSNIPKEALSHAFAFFDNNRSMFANKKYMGVIDFTQHSGQKRFYIIDLVNGNVEKLHVAHGVNSDRNNDGYADSFSNTSGSRQSSLGFVRGAETYYGKYGYSLRLDGLQARNSRVRSRAIVLHGANYVSPNRSKMGRSWGCPSVRMSIKNSVVNRLKNGALIYMYHADQI